MLRRKESKVSLGRTSVDAFRPARNTLAEEKTGHQDAAPTIIARASPEPWNPDRAPRRSRPAPSTERFAITDPTRRIAHPLSNQKQLSVPQMPKYETFKNAENQRQAAGMIIEDLPDHDLRSRCGPKSACTTLPAFFPVTTNSACNAR